MSRKWNRAHPQALIYYALASPVILTELILLNLSLSNSDSIASSVETIPYPAWLLSIIVQLVQLVPWILLAASLYALFSVRPSTLIILQTIFFLFLTSTLGQLDFFLAGMLVFSAFTTLLGFNYVRAAKVLAGRKLTSESRGPSILRATTLGFDMVLPISAALGAMAIVALIMNVIQAQVKVLPQPLSTLGTLYLQSNFYLILTTISVAGSVIWVMRELLEPIVMRFTMSKADAGEIAFSQIADIARKTWWESTKRPGRGRGPLVVSVLVAMLLVTMLIATQGPAQLANNFLSIIGVSRVPPSRPEVLASNIAKNAVRLIDRWTLTVESIAKFIMKLLWG
jgi:hypothetical protein